MTVDRLSVALPEQRALLGQWGAREKLPLLGLHGLDRAHAAREDPLHSCEGQLHVTHLNSARFAPNQPDLRGRPTQQDQNVAARG